MKVLIVEDDAAYQKILKDTLEKEHLEVIIASDGKQGIREIAKNRPDIIEAERLMAAANEKVGIAQASFFPSITLTGSAGYNSLKAGNLFAWESRIWSIGPSVGLPIFNGGRLNAELQAEKAEYDKSLAEYRKRVLTAFSETENALADLRMRKEQSEAQQKLLDAARRAAELSIQRYKEGLVSFLEVIDAERSRLQAERDTIEIHAQELIAVTQFVKAIGWNWTAPMSTNSK